MFSSQETQTQRRETWCYLQFQNLWRSQDHQNLRHPGSHTLEESPSHYPGRAPSQACMNNPNPVYHIAHIKISWSNTMAIHNSECCSQQVLSGNHPKTQFQLHHLHAIPVKGSLSELFQIDSFLPASWIHLQVQCEILLIDCSNTKGRRIIPCCCTWVSHTRAYMQPSPHASTLRKPLH